MKSIYPQLNIKIKSILDGVVKIKKVYSYPATKIDAYPAAIFYPANTDNSFENTQENFKTYGYKLWIVVNANGTNVETIFSSVMPGVMDAVMEAIDKEWSFNTIDGHRVWCSFSTGAWGVSENNNSIEITAEINLNIKMLTSN